LKLERDFGIRLPEFDADDLSFGVVVGAMGKLVADNDGWGISDRVVLSTFTFHKEAMYRDLEQNADLIRGHDLIQLMALGPDAPSADSFAYLAPDDADLDDVAAPEQLHSILDADSSQRRCIAAARDGYSFVMDGPPGTGKSQTIANIIAELMSLGKSVLFVSEKAAALDVVRDRLAARKLDPFIFELHSHSATRKQVVSALGAELTRRPVIRSRFDGSERAELIRAREDFTSYAAGMNELRWPLGRSLQGVLGRLSQLTRNEAFLAGDQPSFAQLSPDKLALVASYAQGLSSAWRPGAEGEDFLWRDLRTDNLTTSEMRGAAAAAAALSESSATLIDEARLFDTALPFLTYSLSWPDILLRQGIRQQLESKRAVPDSWWTMPDLGAVQSRVDRLIQSHKECSSRNASLDDRTSRKWSPADAEYRPPLAEFIGSDPLAYLVPLETLSLSDISLLETQLQDAKSLMGRLIKRASSLGGLFGTATDSNTLAKVKDLSALGLLSQEEWRPETGWFDPSSHSALDVACDMLKRTTFQFTESEELISSIYKNEILELDVQGLKNRFEFQHKGLKYFAKQARVDKSELKSVTFSGKADKEARHHLDKAIDCQAARAQMTAAEAESAGILGGYYRGTETDFEQIARAITLARDICRLAGPEIRQEQLAAQLSRSASPSPSLYSDAAAAGELIPDVQTELRRLFNPNFVARLEHLPLLQISESLVLLGEHLTRSSETRSRLADLLGPQGTVSQSIELLNDIDSVNRLSGALIEQATEDQKLIGDTYIGHSSDFDSIVQDIQWCESARALFNGPLDDFAVTFLGDVAFPAGLLESALNQWLSDAAALTSFFAPHRASELQGEFELDLSNAGAAAGEMSETAIADIDIWGEYRRCSNWLRSNGLEKTLESLIQQGATGDLVPDAMEWAALQPWAEKIIAEDSRLASFRASTRDTLVDKFRDLDTRMVENANAAVISACSAFRPRSNVGSVAILSREAQKKARHLPIRALLTQTGEVAQAIKPCFMMSPLAVSQYLPPGLQFDVVIFDEASQVLPSDAINSIYRGKQLIVAGDQKQLPPTSFFTASTEDEETQDEDAPDVFDSLLDLCKASGALPTLPLTWHYRSQHEDLITYSNYRFYEGQLNTFPGATHTADDLGVHFEYVKGVYRRGLDSKNLEEAERVVDRIVEHRRRNPGLSLGVVTFSSAQAEAVTEAIERRAESEPILVGLTDDHDRLNGFFVKNLESVQGDERDVIIFSVGYGPDAEGKIAMNFGPLTRKGGQRRLNVAITRARRRVEVVSSMRGSDLSEGASEGNRHLKNYLDYAERGKVALASDLRNGLGEAESPFEEEVIRVIESWGYVAVPQVGSAGYRVDIAIRHPDKPGSYILGVECDGAAYYSAKTARDRDRLRESILRNLGWRIHRIWGISWYRNRGEQEALLKAIIDEAAGSSQAFDQGQCSKLEQAPDVEFEEVDLNAAPSWSVPYRSANIPFRRRYYEPGVDKALPSLINYCSEVVAVEAPMHFETLLLRLRSDWGIGRAGHRIQENVRKALGAVRIDGARLKVDSNDFIRVIGAPDPQVRRPDGEEIRKAGAIPPEEMDAAIRHVLEDAAHATEDEVQIAVRGVFGWSRRGSDIQVALQQSVYRLLKKKLIERGKDGRLRMAQ
jgi:very-short-patch-repair endonuclease